MNILIVNTLYYPFRIGGAEESVRILSEELVNLGHSVSVITLTNQKSKSVESVNGVNVYRFPIKNIYWPFDGGSKSFIIRMIWHFIDNYNIFYNHEILKIISKVSPDVAHTNNLLGFSTAIWGLLARHKIPIVHTSRDYYLLHRNTTLYKNGINLRGDEFSCKLYSYTKKKMSKYVNSFVGISDFIRCIHTKNGFFNKIENGVIYNSIESIPVRPIEKKTSKKFIIGFLGRISEEKGIYDFLALADLFSNNIDVSFVVGGDDSDFEHEKYSNVIFLGRVDKSYFFSMIDLLIVPSKWHEPFGRVVIEAASFQIPVIASQVGGICELYKEFNIVGESYQPGNISELYTIVNCYYNEFVSGNVGLETFDLNGLSSNVTTNRYILEYINVINTTLSKG